jgi:hypothetical protein
VPSAGEAGGDGNRAATRSEVTTTGSSPRRVGGAHHQGKRPSGGHMHGVKASGCAPGRPHDAGQTLSLAAPATGNQRCRAKQAKSPLPDSNRRPLPYHGSPGTCRDTAQRAKVPAYAQESGFGIRPHPLASFGTLRYRVGTLTDTPETRSVTSVACWTRTDDPVLTKRRAATGLTVATTRPPAGTFQACGVTLGAVERRSLR